MTPYEISCLEGESTKQCHKISPYLQVSKYDFTFSQTHRWRIQLVTMVKGVSSIELIQEDCSLKGFHIWKCFLGRYSFSLVKVGFLFQTKTDSKLQAWTRAFSTVISFSKHHLEDFLSSVTEVTGISLLQACQISSNMFFWSLKSQNS